MPMFNSLTPQFDSKPQRVVLPILSLLGYYLKKEQLWSSAEHAFQMLQSNVIHL